MALSTVSVVEPAGAQSRAAVTRERAEYQRWLKESPGSPVSAAARDTLNLTWYAYDSGPVFLTRLRPAVPQTVVPLVTGEGILIRLTVMGTVTVSLGGNVVALTVYRVPNAGAEPFYEVHLRDASNGHTTPLAGRFIELIAMGDNRFLLDANRARSPWCAYSAAVPCPDAWPSETVNAWVQVGEYLPGLPRQ